MKNDVRVLSTADGVIGFAGLLTAVLIVLKLTRVISWSWVWVLAPLLITALITLLVLLAMAIFIATRR